MNRLLYNLLLIFPLISFAQYSVPELERWRVQTTRNNMLILGGWAVANIGVGIAGMNTTTGSTYYFHQMNIGWNAVNLGIAALGYALTRPEQNATEFSLSKKMISIENSLMLNTGLDFAYITAGIAMRELSKSANQQNPDQLRGFGSSLILQGAFLAVFDIYQVIVYQKKRNGFLKNRLSAVDVTASPQGIIFHF